MKKKPQIFPSGLDDYKLDSASFGASLGVGYILKRKGLSPNDPCEKIVAVIEARNEPQNKRP